MPDTVVPSRRVRWLTRNVFAIGMLSLWSDMGHELTTAILPLFLASLGSGALALGAIEGISDASSSLMQMWMSYYSDRIGRRKPILVVGYFVTAFMGSFAFVSRWWELVVIRTVGWIGRGARGPLRDALLSESVAPEAHGRAFGFESAMDTTGAVLGPLIGLLLIGIMPIRHIFLVSFIPGSAAVLIAAFGIRDLRRLAQPHLRFWSSVHRLPREFWNYVASVGVFGLGNFAHTLLVLRAIDLLKPIYGGHMANKIAIALYTLHNLIYASISYPAGSLADKRQKAEILAVGYILFGIMALLLLIRRDPILVLIAVFVLAGLYIGIVDGIQRAMAADLIPFRQRGIGFGVLASANSIGDLGSSICVGWLWGHRLIKSGVFYAATLAFTGAVLLLCLNSSTFGRPKQRTISEADFSEQLQ